MIQYTANGLPRHLIGFWRASDGITGKKNRQLSFLFLSRPSLSRRFRTL